MNKTVNPEDFRIRLDLIVRDDIPSTRNWRTNPVVTKMVKMVHPFKGVCDLFEEVISNKSINLEQKYHNWLPLAKSENIRDRDYYLKKIRDFVDDNLYFEADTNPNLYYIKPNQYFGVNLNQPIELPSDHEDFPLLFSFRFSKTKHPAKFLEFHFVNTFNQDKDSFRLLLTQLDKSMISERSDFVNEWRDQNLREQTSSKRTPRSKPIKEKETFKLYFGKKTERARSMVSDFLFDKTTGGHKGRGKGYRIRQLAGALEIFITTQERKYNASEFARVLEHEFGDKLGNKLSTLEGYTKYDKLIKNEASKEFSQQLLSIL